MPIDRRSFLAYSAALAAPGLASAATDPSFPAKPVTILVGFTAGGPVDVTARAIADQLSKMWKQPVIVEVRPGANGTAAAALLSKAPADGYTLLMGTRSLTMNAALYTKLPYNAATAFTPIAIGARLPTVLVASKQSQIRDFSTLLARLKADPGKYTYASTGNGSIPHMAGTLFQKLTQTHLSHIPYKGGSALIVDLITGRVDMSFASLATVAGQIQTGQVTAIAVAADKRAAAFPDMPTFDEAGLQGFNVDTWYGLLAPAGTPAEVIARINADVNAALAQPDVKARLSAGGFDISAVSPAEFKRQYDEDLDRYGKLIRELNLTLD